MIDYHLGVEDIEPDHFVAWVFELPGCYSSGRTADEAIHSAPARLAAYYDWRARHGRPSPAANAPAQVQVAETFHAFPGHDDPDYRVNAFFEDDRRPLTQGEVDDALWLLDGTRRDLLEVVERIPPEKRAAFIAGERFQTINGILRHVAIAEWWYFDRLDLG
jgi:predicted RNase H-like HicB family nuclease